MTSESREIDDLNSDDLKACAVWQFANDDETSETAVCPVAALPVDHLDGRLVGTFLRLANGTQIHGFLGNIDLIESQWNEHLMTVTVFSGDRRFYLARYHDIGRDENGPEGLARFLQLPIDQVFPISYDIRAHCVGSPASLQGLIQAEPREWLTREEILKRALQIAQRVLARESG